MIYMGVNVSGKNVSYTDTNISRKGILVTKTLCKNKFPDPLDFIKYLSLYSPVALYL